MIPANATARPPIRVSCIQFEPQLGAVADNVARASDLVRAAAAEGGRLIVLPELASTGYVFESAAEAAALAETVPDGPTTRAWAALAAELGVHIVAGIAESAGDVLYNAAVIVGPEGYIGTYRKAHLWDQENVFFAKGDLGFPVFDTALGKVGVAICYDGWFPETFRRLALGGAEIVCIPTNWVPMPDQPEGEAAMANTLHRAAAHTNGLFIACADRVGIERGQPFEGQSLIIGATGWPLAGPASRDRTEILSALVDLDAAGRKDLNAFNSLLRDRRTDIYG